MDVLELTEALVSIPSHEDETAAGDYIQCWLEEHTDSTVTRDDAGNVIARRHADTQPSLALVGHHDVVAPASKQVTDAGEYVVEQREGRLHGRGTADMKGSLAAAMIAFRDADPACELVFASFAGEEAGGVGCRAAIEQGFAPDYAIVGEGSTSYTSEGVTDVVVAHNGRRGLRIVASGASAHASEPERGENAIYRATDAIDIVRGVEAPETEVLGHSIDGSITVTEIDGGDAWNVVPEQCLVTVDERTVPGVEIDLDPLEAIDGVSISVEGDLPPMACDEEAFTDAVLSAVAAVQTAPPEKTVKPHATDAGWLASRAGTTCVVCGAAEPGEAHTDAESVSIDAITRCAEVYCRAAETPLR